MLYDSSRCLYLTTRWQVIGATHKALADELLQPGRILLKAALNKQYDWYLLAIWLGIVVFQGYE